jgi:NADH-quinone oxidoreductase subunit J
VNPVVFLLLALGAVGGALTVVFHRNPVHSAVALVVTLFFLSVLFVGLDAQLLAVLQVIVYAGAIVVLFLFIIMLLSLQKEARALGGGSLVAMAGAGGLALAALVVPTVLRSAGAGVASVPAGFGETTAIADRLFTVYLLPFELTSILLLVAIVGAVALVRRGL